MTRDANRANKYKQKRWEFKPCHVQRINKPPVKPPTTHDQTKVQTLPEVTFCGAQTTSRRKKKRDQEGNRPSWTPKKKEKKSDDLKKPPSMPPLPEDAYTDSVG
jgi:hypothetical protein